MSLGEAIGWRFSILAVTKLSTQTFKEGMRGLVVDALRTKKFQARGDIEWFCHLEDGNSQRHARPGAHMHAATHLLQNWCTRLSH